MTTIKAEFINTGRFTPREADIAKLIAEGQSDKEIARMLAISIKTVGVHTQSVYEKLELHSKSINTRCTALATMVARGMIILSLRCVVAVLIFSAMEIDDEAFEALRVRSGRVRGHHHISKTRRDVDA
ncbi:MAG: response regulator transcription factor [Methylobacter sp.]